MDRNQFLIFPLASLALLSGCNRSDVIPENPDSSNPSHCIAAFSYAREFSVNHPEPDMSLIVQLTARTLFEAKSTSASPVFETRNDQFARLSDEQEEEVDRLLFECFAKQDADPKFREANRSGELMRAARKADPVCRAESRCRL